MMILPSTVCVFVSLSHSNYYEQIIRKVEEEKYFESSGESTTSTEGDAKKQKQLK